MALLDLYSHRKRVAEDGMPDIFVYDELPYPLRVQIIQILEDAIGSYKAPDYVGIIHVPNNNEVWKKFHKDIAHEHGVFALSSHDSFSDRCADYFFRCSVDKALDVIEVCFGYIDKTARHFDSHDQRRYGATLEAEQAIRELNERFRRAGVGYQFENGQIFRMDSELIHSEIVQPALRYLHQKGFEGPCDEFLLAHSHYRAGEMKDAIVDANNALESTLKTICDQRNWPYKQGDGISRLLKVVRDKGLFPEYLNNSFDQLIATLKTALPKVRNKAGAHGQGAKPNETPDYVAAYALHLAAAKILFLVEAHKAMKQ